MIPFVDLQAQYRTLKPEIDAAVLKVLEQAAFILGPAVASFEKDFAAFCGTTEAVGVNSGTSALHLALLAAGVGPGDEVITVPFTFIATASAIDYTGAKPVFVDIDPRTFTMDPAGIEAAITPRTKAIVPVHLYGQAADMDPILEIARRHDLVVIEDACQAHGARYKGRRVGSLGDLGCFSFYPGKNLGAYGEGGIIVTDRPDYARTIRMLRDWGAEKKYHHVLKGFNFRLEGMAGAVLRVKLRYLEGWTEARRARAAEYARQLAATPARIPVERPGVRHVYHVYVVELPDRDAWRARLAEADVQTGVHYPIPVHLQPAYRDLGYDAGAFPVAARAAMRVLSLPIFPELTTAQLAEIAAVLQAPMPAASPA